MPSPPSPPPPRHTEAESNQHKKWHIRLSDLIIRPCDKFSAIFFCLVLLRSVFDFQYVQAATVLMLHSAQTIMKSIETLSWLLSAREWNKCYKFDMLFQLLFFFFFQIEIKFTPHKTAARANALCSRECRSHLPRYVNHKRFTCNAIKMKLCDRFMSQSLFIVLTRHIVEMPYLRHSENTHKKKSSIETTHLHLETVLAFIANRLHFIAHSFSSNWIGSCFQPCFTIIDHFHHFSILKTSFSLFDINLFCTVSNGNALIPINKTVKRGVWFLTFYYFERWTTIEDWKIRRFEDLENKFYDRRSKWVKFVTGF